MRVLLLTISLVLIQAATFANNRQSKIASVPFEVVGTYVVVKVYINHSSSLHFILDSGLGATIITELMAEDSLELNYTERTTLKGLGNGKVIEAMISRGNTLQTGRMKFVNQMVNFLSEDVFNLSQYTGKKINGLLGSDFFQDQVVKIDYDTQHITFYESSSFEVPTGYIAIPLTLKNNKMYARLLASEGQGKPAEVLMLIDTGAELAAWFRSYGSNAVPIPDKRVYGYIGQGLNGQIEGYVGRLNKLYFGGHCIHNPIVSFPDSACLSEIVQAPDRDGTIGSQLLCRFNLIFDEPNEMLYIRPNHNFKKPFRYNIAGIEVISQPFFPKLPEVYYVWKNSPADQAGIKPGDLILNVDGLNGFDADINAVRLYFTRTLKKPVSVTVLRDGASIQLKLDVSRSL